MGLESKYFKHNFYYDNARVERFIEIIKSPNSSPQRQQAFKNVVFKMMKDVVKKNMRNYLNLLTNGTSIEKEEIPTEDELVADCYIIFDKCLTKYKLGAGYNFYFYFNKSMSRCFYRSWTKEMVRDNSSIEIGEALETVNARFHTSADHTSNSMNLLLSTFDFNPLELRVIKSRLAGQKTGEFLKANTDVTHNQYSAALKSIKERIQGFRDLGEI